MLEKPNQKEKEKKSTIVGFHLHKIFKIYSDRKQIRLDRKSGKEKRDARTNQKKAPGNISG